MNKDLRIGLVLLVIFLILFGISFTLPVSAMAETHTSPAFFPRIVLIIALGLTCILIMKNLFVKEVSSGNKGLTREQRVRTLGSMGLAVLYGFGTIFIGTFVSMFFLIIAIMFMWGVRNKLVILLNALLTPVFVYYVFTKILLVQFPSGFLF
ncbi:MAG: tripartite tricarboxylate transporter TctB family protein [Deltaproteobacteria bacterium]|nr:tripartite tricarboxylate transporter TctB family protein [Deltaproteobacteria bacterium]MBW2306530.1 tripartite tricarboxylate transporter TctB family protein [Deltaproteobacteria bacterium]